MRESLDFAFFGSSLVSAYWNGAATYYRGLIKNLHHLGHRITFYEPDAFDRQKHRDLDSVDYAESVVYSADSDDSALAALAQASDADVLIKTSGIGVFDQLLEEALLETAKPWQTTIFWDVDAPTTLDRIENDPHDPFRRLIPRYDLIFTYGGGNPVVEAYGRWGARSCVPIYNALDPETHHPVPPDPAFDADLGFLGNRLPDREARVREFFFDPVERLPRRKFLLGGNGWADEAERFPNLLYRGHVYTAQHNAFNCTPRAVLNINRESMARYGFSPPTRVFEAAGAGACLITDAWEGIELFLDPSTECLVAHSGDEVASYVDRLDPQQAKTIGKAARRRVLAEHTYAHRAKLVQAQLLGSPKAKAVSRCKLP